MKHMFRIFHDLACPCRNPGGPNAGSMTMERAPHGSRTVMIADDVVWIEIPESP